MRLSFTNISPTAEATLKACLNDLLFNLNNKDFYVKGILFLGVDSRLGFINTGKLYAVESINGKLAVSVPWTDNDTWRPIKIGDTLLGNEMLSLQPGNNVSLTKLEDVVKINILLGSGSGLNADTVDGKHASDFSTKHMTSLTNFNNAVDSNIVTFDGNNITNKPSGSTWLNGFVSSHSNYLASYIVNEHRTNNWWLGYKDSNNSNTNVSWVNIIHSGNISNQSVASAGSATKLLNVRTINGTNFDGTVNITTANWGTARNITIGNSTKSVNGGTNVSWSLSEIGIDSKFVAINDLPLYINNFTGAVNNGNTYGVELTNGKLTVTVPWTDNDTWRPIKVGDNTLTNDLLSIQPGDSIIISLELVNNTNVVKFSTISPIIKTNYVGNGKNYPVLMDSNKNGYVNVPWTDNDTWRPVKVGNLILDNKLLSILPGNNITITSEDNNNDVVVKITANIPSSLPANGGTSDYSNNFVSHDTRNVNNTPLTFNKGGRFEFKGNSTDGLNDGGSYHGVLYFRPYGSGSDWSGGPAYELGFTLNGNLWMKSGSNDTWGSWKKFINSGELNISNINGMYNWYSSITGTDTDKVINKWNEIISFLANIEDDTTLKNILGGYLPRSGSVVNDKKTDATNKMTGSIWFDNVDGIKINSHNTDRKIWEIVGNSGSYASTYGFHLLYKGTASGNNNTLELYSHNLTGNHVKVSTVYLDGTLAFHTLLTTSYGATHTGIKVGSSYINSLSDQLLLLNTSTIRFGGDTWDWNVWAGLKYDHTNKVIYLGLADGTVFNANSAQYGGTVLFPGVSTMDMRKTASIKNLPVGGGLYWNPYVESTTDGTDAASIYLTTGTAAGGTTLTISLQNDSNDTIQFLTNTSARLYHNSLILAWKSEIPTIPASLPANGGNSTTSAYPLGFNSRNNTFAWGTLGNAANSYTKITDWATTGGSEISFAEKSGLLSVLVDGYFYQREGNSRVADLTDLASYLTTSGKAADSDKVDGYHALRSHTPFGTIPAIGSDGVIELGHYIDFHYDNTTSSDYSTRLYVTENHSNSVALPSSSGTLALTSLIPSSMAWSSITSKPSFVNNGTTSSVAANSATSNGFWYINDGNTNRPPFSLSTNKDYRILATANSDTWVQLIATDFRCNDIFFRRKENGTWKDWVKLITSENIGNQSVNYAASSGSATSAGTANYLSGLTLTDANSNVTTSSSTFTTSNTGKPSGLNDYSAYFTCRGGIDTGFLVAVDYNNSRTFIRGGNNLSSTPNWKTWNEVITSSNIGSQSVNAATNDGNGNNIAESYLRKDSVHTGRNNEANKIVKTDGSGYIQAGWINTTSGNCNSNAIDRIYCSYDGYIRYLAPSTFALNKGATLSWGTAVTVATIAGLNINVTLPSNPNSNTTNTAGANTSTSTLYLIGATSKSGSPVTYTSSTNVYMTNGTLYASAFYQTSDVALKQCILPINTEIAKNIQFVEYEFKSDPGIKKYGVIAQQLESIGLNNLVGNGEHKNVDYISMLCLKIALLELEIKELKNDIVR